MFESVDLHQVPFKAKHLGGSAFCNFYRLGVTEQALGGIPLGFGIVVEDIPFELTIIYMLDYRQD